MSNNIQKYDIPYYKNVFEVWIIKSKNKNYIHYNKNVF